MAAPAVELHPLATPSTSSHIASRSEHVINIHDTPQTNGHDGHHLSEHHIADVANLLLKYKRSKGQRKPWHQKMFKTPKETTEAIICAGVKKSLVPMDKLFMLAVFAGFYVAIGGTWALSMGYGLTTNGPVSFTVQKFVMGGCFSFALMLIIVAGGELFTGNTMYLLAATYHRKISWKGIVYNWLLVYFGNFAGCALGAYFIGYLPQFFEADPWRTGIQHMAEAKCSMNIGVLFLRAVGANWLGKGSDEVLITSSVFHRDVITLVTSLRMSKVCMGVFFSVTAEDMVGKMLSCFFAVCAFASVGFEHSIANMFYVPLGLMLGADVSFGKFIYHNLLIVTLGNIVGGGLMVGTAMWYFYHGFQWEEVPEKNKKPVFFRFSFLQ